MKVKIIILVFLWNLQSICVLEGQDITSISQEGNNVTINGSAFGSNVDVNNIHSLIQNIEDGTNGTDVFTGTGTISDWDGQNACTAGQSPTYDNSDFHSGTQSIKIKIIDKEWSCAFWFSSGVDLTEVYATAWRRFAPQQTSSVTQAQWKVLTISNKSHLGGDAAAYDYFRWYNFSTSSWFNSLSMFVYNSNQINAKDGAQVHPPFDSWFRDEVFVVANSAPLVSDGKHECCLINDKGTVEVTSGVGITHGADASDSQLAVDPWQYVNFGAYYGNISPSEPKSLELWIDDVYVSLGNGKARVEIGNAQTLEACTHREIQIPTSWSQNSITVTVNQGSFANGANAYLFVVGSDGKANEKGYKIKFPLYFNWD